MRSLRVEFLSLLILISAGSFAHADTLEGVLASLDVETRQITLTGGETLQLTEPVSMEGLAIGQLLRLEFPTGTIDVTSLLVLEEPPPLPTEEEPIVEEIPQ